MGHGSMKGGLRGPLGFEIDFSVMGGDLLWCAGELEFE